MNRVLMIEDSDDDIEMAQRVFAKAGLSGTVCVCRDGTQALDFLLGRGAYAAEKPGADIRLILLDLNLPKTSGLDVLREIRLNPLTRQIPIAVLTVSTKEPDLLQCFTMGIKDYLVKPLEPARFAEIYRKFVQEGQT